MGAAADRCRQPDRRAASATIEPESRFIEVILTAVRPTENGANIAGESGVFRVGAIAAILAAAASVGPLRARTAVDDLAAAGRYFESGDYQRSLTTLDGIDRRLRELGAGDTRAALAPALAFYRAADYAMLGARDDAVAGFLEFLKFSPEAQIDAARYPRAVVTAFAQARRKAPRIPGIAAAYEHFAGGSPADETDSSGDFSKGPLASLMTAREREDWLRAVSEEDRAGLIAEFWRHRDASAEASQSPLRAELDRRIAFADSRFRDGETRGSLTDRGQVLLLLGPPLSIGVKPLSQSEDPSVGQQADEIQPLPLGATAEMVREHNLAVDTNPTMAYGAERNVREIWHYRTLPPGIPARVADFDFLTRKGGGTAQLSRTPQALRILDAVRRTLRPD